ncbi:hypothetical protein Q1M63_18285 [Sinorhizobium meliloti]|nr:hypothetical protein Q1M63_18285 [Sinorhizobium meliloti]
MPEMRGRTSAMRVAVMRPGSSLVIGSGSAFVVKTATGDGGGAAAAACCSSFFWQPARKNHGCQRGGQYRSVHAHRNVHIVKGPAAVAAFRKRCAVPK